MLYMHMQMQNICIGICIVYDLNIDLICRDQYENRQYALYIYLLIESKQDKV